MKQRIAEIIEELAKSKSDLAKHGIAFGEVYQKWIDDASFFLDELHERDERIRKLEKIIIEDRIEKM